MILPEKGTIGIYKITSPSNRVYIGQSIDINRRFRTYLTKSKDRQPKLYRSFDKYGVNNHKFEVIHYCSIEELNELERYYQELYDCVKNGLNCVLTESNGRKGELCKETISKIKKSKQNISKETRDKISKGLKGRVPWNKGVKMPENQKIRMSITKKKNYISDNSNYLKYHNSMKTYIKIIDPNNNVFKYGIQETKRELGISTDTLYKILKGGYSEKWKDWTFEYIDKDSD